MAVPIPTIETLVFDGDNGAKLERHRLSRDQVLEAIADAAGVIVRNRAGRRATPLIIGRDRSGRCLAIPVEPTDDPTVWGPVTAWDCKASEAVLLRRRR